MSRRTLDTAVTGNLSRRIWELARMLVNDDMAQVPDWDIVQAMRRIQEIEFILREALEEGHLGAEDSTLQGHIALLRRMVEGQWAERAAWRQSKQ